MKTQMKHTMKIQDAEFFSDIVLRKINITHGKFFTIHFTKRDGTIRKMTCRTGVHKGLKGVGMGYSPSAYNLKTVWDLGKQSYRTINLATTQTIVFQNKMYHFLNQN